VVLDPRQQRIILGRLPPVVCSHKNYFTHLTAIFHQSQQLLPKRQIPTHYHKASVNKTNTKITVTGQADFGDYWTNEATWDWPSQTLNNHWKIINQIEGNIDKLITTIKEHKAFAVSDGSYMNQMGAATWTIESAMAENRIKGSGWTLDSIDDQSAYQSELFGLWGILHTLLCITKECKIKSGGVTVTCDRLAALKKAQHTSPPNPANQYYDINGAIYYIQQLLPLELKFKHVKGHQDMGLTTVLDCTAYMNIECDSRVKEQILTFKEGPQKYKIPHKGWCCYIQDKRVTHNLMTALWEHINGSAIISH